MIRQIGTLRHDGGNGESDLRHDRNGHDGHEMDSKAKIFSEVSQVTLHLYR